MRDIVAKYYPSMMEMLKNQDKVVSLSKCPEDILNDVILRVLKVKGDEDMEYEEGCNYLKKKLIMELFFGKKKTDEIFYTNNILYFERNDREE